MPNNLKESDELIIALPTPSTPLGPLQDGLVSWTTWVSTMGLVGLVALALASAGPVGRLVGAGALASTTVLLARAGAVLGALAVPAILSDTALGLARNGGYDYQAAWTALYDGTNRGRLLGIELTLVVLGVALLVPLTIRRVASGQIRARLLFGALVAGSVALGTTKFPSATPTDWGRAIFDAGIWMLHLQGGAVWIGGLIGLLILALPGVVSCDVRGVFFEAVIRRFSIVAMSSVAAVTLSGLWLYRGHVDGPTQLLTTMYGRVLGVKILIFGTMLLLGMVNQLWLYPRIDGLRSAGDHRPLRILLARKFPAIIAVEVMLGLGVLMVAPFLHGSARNQAFQHQVAEQAVTALSKLPRLPAKPVIATTWIWGAVETVVVIGAMIAVYRMSGRIAARRVRSSPADT